jgi:hypothetical protein
MLLVHHRHRNLGPATLGRLVTAASIWPQVEIPDGVRLLLDARVDG